MIPMMLLFGESAQKRSVNFLNYDETFGLGMICRHPHNRESSMDPESRFKNRVTGSTEIRSPSDG
jgi:hypothetical protein